MGRLTGADLAGLLAGKGDEHLGGPAFLFPRGNGAWTIDATIDLDRAAQRIEAEVRQRVLEEVASEIEDDTMVPMAEGVVRSAIAKQVRRMRKGN